MADHRKEIDNLQFRLEELLRKQEYFGSEIRGLQLRIDQLRDLLEQEAQKPLEVSEIIPESVVEIIGQPVEEIPVIAAMSVEEVPMPQPQAQPQQASVQKPDPVVSSRDSGSGLERYIGENLIPVIGIIITVIGVGIGAKYAIDHQLITPLTRILLGYLMGAGLLFFAVRLKRKYHEFSAVLLSGSMAIFYFITFFAYSFYGLIPLPATFLLMVVITGATVYAAIHYNLQVIAHVGLVGAYAVPFLLSNGSGKIGIFFSYMAVINIGILIVSFFRNWKSLYYVSFGLSWLIYILWFVSSYEESHFALGMLFLAVFFVIFYATNLAYKLIKQEAFDEIDGMLVLFNSLIFYGMGMTVLATHYAHHSLLGWFTLLNAGIHFGISGMMYLRKAGDHTLFYLSMGLGLCFLTVFIPVKLDGNWITLSWIMEGGLLFWVGRTQGASIYERFSHPIMLLAFISLGINYFGSGEVIPFWNVHLLTSLLFAGILFSVYRLSKQTQYTAAYANNEGMLYLTNNLVYVLLLVIAFFAIQKEISSFWSQRYDQSEELALNKDYFIERGDQVLKSMEIISNVLYSLLFLSVMAYFRRQRQNTEEFNVMFVMAFFLCIFLFLTVGLYQLNFMHLKYLYGHNGAVISMNVDGQWIHKEVGAGNVLYYRGFWLVGVRYVSYAIMAFSVFQLIRFVRLQMPWRSMGIISEYLFHTVIIWCCSAELVNWVHAVNSEQTYKLALSIFAGLYALFMVVLGIWKQKSYLRIGAISLFGITLLKLFFYDIRQMDTIFKTVIFISLGVLLLVIAFLYNKYKGRMFEQ